VNHASHSPLNFSDTVRDRALVKGPSVMAYGETNGHMNDDVTWPRKVKSWPPMANTLRVQYCRNSWRCYLATIANYWIVCCEAVRSAILATAWLLVDNLQRETFSHSQLHMNFSVFYPISAKKW